MPKIAIVDLVINFPPHGGASTDIIQIATRLAKKNEVCFFIPSFRSRAFDRCKIRSDFPLPVKWLKFNPFNFNFYQAPKMFKEYINAYKPDYVFFADGWYLKPFLLKALRNYNTILRIYAHELLCTKSKGYFYRWGKLCHRNHFKDSVLSVLGCKLCTSLWIIRHHNRVFGQEFLFSLAFLPRFQKIVKDCFHNADTIIVYNHSIKNKIDPYNDNVRVIPSGVDAKLFAPSLEADRSTIKILMVGLADDPCKGFSILKNALTKLRKNGYNVRLLVTSKRTYKEGFIESLGWLDQQKLAKVYNQADICVIPSIWPEPFGMVSLEAMSCSKPLIASHHGGLKEIIDEGETGLLFEPGNSNDLYEKLALLIKDANLRKILGKKGREKVIENYDWDIIYNKYYENMFT